MNNKPNLETATVPDDGSRSANSQWDTELSEQIRFDKKVPHYFQRQHFLNISRAIETILSTVLDQKKQVSSANFLKIIVLDRLRLRFRKKYLDVYGSRKNFHRITLTLSEWIVLHTCLIWDWGDLSLRVALGEIDYLVQSHCHNKIILEKVNLLS